MVKCACEIRSKVVVPGHGPCPRPAYILMYLYPKGTGRLQLLEKKIRGLMNKTRFNPVKM